MAKPTTKEYAIALYEITRGLNGEKLSEAIRGFVALLAQKRLLKKGNAIIEAFVRYNKQQEGIVDLTVVSARTLDRSTMEHIKKAFGGKAEITNAIDENLIGGVYIKTTNKIFDASLKTQLQRLKQQLS